MSEKRTLKKMSLFVGILTVIFGLLFTQARSAIVAVLIGFILSNIKKRTFIETVRYTFFVLFIILVSTMLIPKFFPQEYLKYAYIDAPLSPQKGGLLKRADGIWLTLSDITKRPLFGYGTGAVSKYHYVASDFKLRSDLPVPVAIGIESGVLAMLAFIGIILFSLSQFFNVYRKEDDMQKREMSFYLFLSIFSYFLATLTNQNFVTFFTLFSLLAGVNFIGYNKKICIR
jgi:O-antigen ligase